MIEDSPRVNMCLYETNTHSSVFDEGVTELGHFGPGHRYLLQKKFASLFHHLLTARQVLTEQRHPQLNCLSIIQIACRQTSNVPRKKTARFTAF